MRSEVQKVAWRSYWPVTLLAVTFLLVVVFFGTYLTARQQVADERQHLANARAEKQRQAICAILANIPGHIPAEIASARIVFARPDHPADCLPIVHPPKPTPAPTITVTPSPQATVVIVSPPQPTATVTATHRARPTSTRSPSPTPRPSPSRTCVLIICA